MAGRPTDDELRRRIADAWAVVLDDVPIRADLPTTDAAWMALAERLALVIDQRGPRVQPLPPTAAQPPLPAAPAPLRPPPDPAAAIADLLAWGEAQGIDARAIEVKLAADGNRTVAARRPIADGEELVVVPRAALVTELDVADAPIGVALTRAAPPLDSRHTPIALWLASERRDPTSRWRPYLDALPAQVPLPWSWDADRLDDLRGTHAALAIERLRAGVLADHAAIVARLPRLALGLDELAWGRAIASSRLFRVNLAGVDRVALAPIADLFDHGPADARWTYHEDRAVFTITAKRAIAAGEPIHLSYGKKALARFVTGYGFAPADGTTGVEDADATRADPDDPRLEDVAALTFAGLLDDPRAALAIHLIWGQDLDRPLTLTAPAVWDERARRVLSIARLLVADGRELIHAVDRGRFQRGELGWLSARNERAALARIEEAAHAGRAAMAATDEADRAALADPAVTGWPRIAAALRTGERAVLDRWAELAALAAPLHGERSPWSWRRAADRREGDGHPHPLATGYLRQVADELPG